MEEARQVKEKESERELGKTDVVSKSVPLTDATFFLSAQMETVQNWHFVL